MKNKKYCEHDKKTYLGVVYKTKTRFKKKKHVMIVVADLITIFFFSEKKITTWRFDSSLADRVILQQKF